MAKKQKKLRFSLIMAITVSLMSASIIAVAAILPQLQPTPRQNEFEPVTPQIAIKENDSEPQPTATNEMIFYPDEDKTKYTADKKVQITNSGNDEYIKVALIPQWYDSKGRLCGGLENISNFGIPQEPDMLNHTQKYINSQNTDFVILTYHLSPNWSNYWQYDKNTGFYHYKNILKKGQTTEPLILSVEVSAEVYQLSSEYELQIDVVTESIQTTATADQIRAFGRKE